MSYAADGNALSVLESALATFPLSISSYLATRPIPTIYPAGPSTASSSPCMSSSGQASGSAYSSASSSPSGSPSGSSSGAAGSSTPTSEPSSIIVAATTSTSSTGPATSAAPTTLSKSTQGSGSSTTASASGQSTAIAPAPPAQGGASSLKVRTVLSVAVLFVAFGTLR